MSAFSVVGGRKLRGQVNVSGSKNSALAILSSVVLAEGPTILQNVPNVSDTRIKAELLRRFGAKVEWREGSLIIDATHLEQGDVDEDMARSIRTSFFLLGPLLARVGKVSLPAPGGCKIGARPVDYHIKGLRAMGADVEFSHGTYLLKADKLRGAEIYLDHPSAGATQHLMATATLAEGVTTIQNAAMEPEVTSLARFLNAMGAIVDGAGTSAITIQGRETLDGTEFRVPADRIQAGTYLIAGAITGGKVRVNDILPDEQMAVVNKLREMGANVDEGPDWIEASATDRLTSTKIKTMPYPGFPTDMQQPMAALLSVAEGTSVVEETIYESRIGHIQELNRMGADIRVEGRTTLITGVERLRGSVVEASDLRAGAALVLAALSARGETIVKNIHWIDRGYEKLEETIQSLGGRIERISASESEYGKAGDSLS